MRHDTMSALKNCTKRLPISPLTDKKSSRAKVFRSKEKSKQKTTKFEGGVVVYLKKDAIDSRFSLFFIPVARDVA